MSHFRSGRTNAGVEAVVDQNWVFDKESFFDFLGFTIQCAPDFPTEDFLESHEQLNLDRAFGELCRGLGILQPDLSGSGYQDAQQLLESAFAKFRDGDEVGGSQMLQQLDRQLFPKRVR